MTTPPEAPKPPRPPYGSKISYDKEGNLCVAHGFSKWRHPAGEVTVQTLDQMGQRVTVTRALTVGLLALGAKKKTGTVTVIFSTPAGETLQHRVKATFGERTLSWAIAFNAWRDAVHPEVR
ncbi:MAG: hypothetical protein HOW97_09635 [Catenulispora sp.]|nr:hypothetical protein [Catenulispora sp.]